MESEYECSWPYGTRIDAETIEVPVRGETVKFALTQVEVEETFSISGHTLDKAVFYLVDNLEPGDVFYDIGAHIGSYSTVVGALCPDVHVVAFEPHPVVREKLRENLAVNGVEADVYGYGISGRNGCGTWTDSGAPRCMASVGTPSSEVKHNHRNSLQVRTLDRVVDEEDLPLPTMLKVDIEGHEVAFLRNAEQVLTDERVRQLDIEVHPPMIESKNESPADVVTVLESYGYTVFTPEDIEARDSVFHLGAWKDSTGFAERFMRFASRDPDEE